MIPTPRRIVLLKPCCIGDVINATPLLTALRRAYPQASITWAVGSTAQAAINDHPLLNHIVDTGARANPASHPSDMLRLVRLLRQGRPDLIVVPDRSPLLGIAALLAGIPRRAGLDSAGRGFAYTIKATIDPHQIRYEADIYLDVARALGLDTRDCWANVPPSAEALAAADAVIRDNRLERIVVVHPGGGVNAGMSMVEKRYPPERFAALADRIAAAIKGAIVVIGASSDAAVVSAFKAASERPVIDLSQQLSLPVIGALANRAALYLGNDNGVAHLAAASGGKVLMIFGPSDPRRYAPFVPPTQARVAWRQFDLPAQGVVAGNVAFDWQRDGVSVDEAWERARILLDV
jgi:ADP-heptose:LPS heptosyltransferase